MKASPHFLTKTVSFLCARVAFIDKPPHWNFIIFMSFLFTSLQQLFAYSLITNHQQAPSFKYHLKNLATINE